MTSTRRLAIIALPFASAGLIGAAAVGLAGSAHAATTDVRPPIIVATPTVKAQPPVLVYPGHRWHREHIVIDGGE